MEDAGLQVSLRQSEALPAEAGEPFELDSDGAWLQFYQQRVPELRAAGWQVLVRPDFQFNLQEVDDWYAQIDEAPEHDRFDLELGIELDGQRISLLPILLQAIRRTPWLLNGDTVR